MRKKEKLKICVTGAIETNAYGLDALDVAKDIGKIISDFEAVLVTGSGSGFSLWAAIGANEAGGQTIMFSPAGSKREHNDAYRLPSGVHDIVIYTGFGYVGAEVLMTKSVDAVIIGPGKPGSIHEFTMAYEEGRPIGVLEGDWDTDELIRKVIGNKNRTDKPVVFDSDPKKLVKKVIEMINK